jgi:hypothetical protein
VVGFDMFHNFMQNYVLTTTKSWKGEGTFF